MRSRRISKALTEFPEEQALIPLETPRLVIRPLTEHDAEFVLDLLNQPSFIQFIGDRQVRTPSDARHYILNGPMAMYELHDLGLCAVTLRSDGTAIGIAGLIKRETLPNVDLGFALLPAFWKQGYAREASVALLDHGHRTLGLHRIVAIANPDNVVSKRLLRDLGFTSEGTVRLTENGTELDLLVSTTKDSGNAVNQESSGEASSSSTTPRVL